VFKRPHTDRSYAGPITIGVMLVGALWYLVYARRHYHGPAEMTEFPVDEAAVVENQEREEKV